jgi:hypothetical protein
MQPLKVLDKGTAYHPASSFIAVSRVGREAVRIHITALGQLCNKPSVLDSPGGTDKRAEWKKLFDRRPTDVYLSTVFS